MAAAEISGNVVHQYDHLIYSRKGIASKRGQSLFLMSLPYEVILKNGTKLTVAEVDPADAQKMIDYLNVVGGESGNLTFGENDFPLKLESETEFIRGVREKQKEVFLKGTVEGEVVGTVTITRPPRIRIFHIGTLGISVRKAYWALGVGKAILRPAIDLAKARGVTKINLTVRDDNEHAIKLYKKMGFVEEGVTSRSLWVDGKYYPSVLMGLDL